MHYNSSRDLLSNKEESLIAGIATKNVHQTNKLLLGYAASTVHHAIEFCDILDISV